MTPMNQAQNDSTTAQTGADQAVGIKRFLRPARQDERRQIALLLVGGDAGAFQRGLGGQIGLLGELELSCERLIVLDDDAQ